MTDFSKRYLAEVGRRLHHEGFRIWPEHEGLLLVEKDARQVCTVNIRGSMGYDPDYVRQNGLEDILEQVRMITRETNTYMHLMEQAPPLLAEGLTGDYRLLAEFNGAVHGSGYMTVLCGRDITTIPAAERTPMPRPDVTSPSAPGCSPLAFFLRQSSLR